MNHIKPFKICGNIYFVGTEPASSHLIATEEGLILLDSGYPQTLHHVIESIWELGFDPREIRCVIHSHGHYDHLGATRALLELADAETFLGAEDVARHYGDSLPGDSRPHAGDHVVFLRHGGERRPIPGRHAWRGGGQLHDGGISEPLSSSVRLPGEILRRSGTFEAGAC